MFWLVKMVAQRLADNCGIKIEDKTGKERKVSPFLRYKEKSNYSKCPLFV